MKTAKGYNQRESFEICNDVKHFNQLADNYQLCKHDYMHA